MERLRRDFARYMELQPILWEHEPQRATAHFQEQIVLPSQTDIVVCILWSRLGTRLPPDKYRRKDGTPYLSGTEFEDASASYRDIGTPDLLVYRKTSEPLISLTDEQVIRERLEQKRALKAFWDRWFGNPRDAFQTAFATFESPRQFADLLEDHLRKLIGDRLPPHAADDQPLARWTRGVSPYRGLEAFDAEHATVYYRRKRAVDDTLVALSLQHEKGCAFLLIFGMSGCGKSSLVRAGISPRSAGDQPESLQQVPSAIFLYVECGHAHGPRVPPADSVLGEEQAQVQVKQVDPAGRRHVLPLRILAEEPGNGTIDSQESRPF